MPSPIAHSLLGLAIGMAWALPRAPRRELAANLWAARGSLAAAVFAANAPDLDYVPGVLTGDLNAFHPSATHSVPFVAGLAAAMAVYRRAGRACAFAWLSLSGASHLLADMVTEDLRAPYGIPALWPFSTDRLIAPFSIFLHLRKREWGDIVQWHNVIAVLWEIAITLPFVMLVAWLKTRAHESSKETIGRAE